MAQQQVYVVMARTDIPSGVLQMTELKPNDSQRNYIYEPPGQTQYVKNIPTTTVLAPIVAAGPPVTTSRVSEGMGAYLIDNVAEGTTGLTLLPAVIDPAAAAVIAAAQAGTVLDLAAINAILVGAGADGATDLTAGGSTGSVADVLGILAGRVYVVPSGSVLSDGGGLFVAPVGSFQNNDEIKQLYETSAFRISNGDGQIAGFKRADFDYLGTEAPAVTVYAADGTLL